MLSIRLSGGTIVVAGALVALSPAAAQQGTPPPRDQLPAYAEHVPPLAPMRSVDPRTGVIFEIGPAVEPVFVPVGGILPHGTLPDPQREAGRPMRPGVTPWIPDGTGYWAPAVEDQAGGGTRALAVHKNFEGPGPNGLTPPDPDLARGYEYVVATTNDDFAVYDSCGNEVFYSDINDFLNLPGHFLYDCKVIFDPWGGRWVMMYHNRDDSPQLSELVMYVTADDDPPGVGSGWYYRFNAIQDAGTGDASWADYFDLGYSNRQIYAAGNMFRFAGGYRWARLMFFNKTQMYAADGTSYLWWSNLTNGDGSTTDTPRTAKMQVSWSEGDLNVDGVFINSRWGGGNKLTLWKARDVFGTNQLAKFDIGVGNYVQPPDATQPSGEKLDTIDPRLMPAVVSSDFLGQNGTRLFTGLTTDLSGNAACHLFSVDPISATLAWERVFFGSDWDYWFPSVAADYSGSAYWVFSRTQNAAGGEAEMRFVDMNKGTFSNSSTGVKDGTGSYNGFRWGDYFGGQMDWGDYGANGTTRAIKVWLYGEYAKPDNWGTHVCATSVFPQGSMSGVQPTTTWVLSGPQGGPFTPSSRLYTLQSASGDTGVAFRVTSLPSWLDATRTYGQLWTDTTVTLSVNSSANSLAPGTYNDTVFFSDCSNGGSSYTRAVQLIVQADCYADYNGDGVVDTRDVLAFLNDWNAGSSKSDCDGNRLIDTRDVLCFLNAWNAGC